MNKIYTKLILLTLFLTNFSCINAETKKDIYELRRDNMVKRQIESRDIKNKEVLNAMKKVKRHKFVPIKYINVAYADKPLPIGYGQTISQPYIVALMTEYLKLNKNSKVLEIGTGSGYQAAILGFITKNVYTVEIIKELHDRANKVFKTLKYDYIKTKFADGYYGWEKYAPYDAIIVTCASEFVPPPLVKQLKVGGIMCIPVGPPFRVQKLVLIKKITEEDIKTEIITYVRFVPLTRKK